MYITNKETSLNSHEIISYLPRDIRKHLYNIDLTGASEIRMRLGKPLSIYFPDGLYYIGIHGNLTQIPTSALRVSRSHIEEALELASHSSVYSVKDEIKNGFITIRGGHRIGITGSAVLKEDKVSFIKDISALNFRIASEIKGAADKVMPYILNGSAVKNTLIISPPGAGKTTMLRDIARQLSYKCFRVSIVDERREIAALFEGKSSFDLGFSVDVLEGADKAEGMLMVLRSMSPDVIITDEIGKPEDVQAIEKITNSGASVITTIHGKNLDMVRRRADLNSLLGCFDLVITLSRRCGAGTVEEAVSV